MQGKMASSSRTRTVLPSTLLVVVFVLVFVTACSHAFEISLPVGQVTPTGCAQHRDGVRFAIRKINELNGGKGFAIGFDQTDYVKFTDNTQVVDDTVFTGDDYDTEHQRVLDVLASDAQKHLVVGTCSPKSENEKTIATNRQTVVLALVGPNAYYEDKLDYVFGMHISSYTYTEPSFKSFAFEGAKTVAIAGRKQSLFFQTTCAEGEKYAQSYGMTLSMPRVEYEASGAGSLVKDVDYQRQVAKDMCESGADVYAGCVGFDEAKVWLQVWEEMDCKPKAVWLTCMGWGWKGGMGTQIPDGQYILGAGQWHSAMTYSDPVVGNSTDFAREFEPIYGFEPSYDAVAAYAAVYVYMKAVQKAFREVSFSSTDGSTLINDNYEKIRRSLSFLIERDTIYGPVEFDLEYGRNIGRQPANMQFLGDYEETNDQMVDYCVAPSDVANAALLYPTPNSVTCDAGKRYVSNANLVPGAGEERCLLCNKCLDCENTYEAMVGSCDFEGKRKVTYRWPASVAYRCSLNATLPPSKQIDCDYIPMDSGMAMGVIIVNALCMVYTLVNIAFVMAKSNEQVVKRSQPFFMVMFLTGALICNVASFPFLGPAENIACAVRPLLISAGAAMMLSALVVKMLRIKKIITMAEKLVAKAVTVQDMLPTALAMVGVVLGIWIAWVAIDAPVRTATLKVVDPYNVYKEYECSTTSVFETLLIFYCGGILLYACVMAYQIRKMPDDLQETKALLFSAYTIFLFTVFGIPLLFMIKDNMVRVLLLSIFINIPTVVTVFCLCMPKVSSVMGWKPLLSLSSPADSAFTTMQTIMKSGQTKVTPSPTADATKTTTTASNGSG